VPTVESEVRRVPLVKLIDDFGILLSTNNHLNKNSGKALYRILDRSYDQTRGSGTLWPAFAIIAIVINQDHIWLTKSSLC
jgi:hypothetical protein